MCKTQSTHNEAGAVHEAALDLAEAGLMSKRTMRAFDEMCQRIVNDTNDAGSLQNKIKIIATQRLNRTSGNG